MTVAQEQAEPSLAHLAERKLDFTLALSVYETRWDEKAGLRTGCCKLPSYRRARGARDKETGITSVGLNHCREQVSIFKACLRTQASSAWPRSTCELTTIRDRFSGLRSRLSGSVFSMSAQALLKVHLW